MDSWKAAISSPVRSMCPSGVAGRATTGACTLNASKRTFAVPIDAWRARVRFARVPANVQVCIGAPSDRDITKCVPEDTGISSVSACNAACADDAMPWEASEYDQLDVSEPDEPADADSDAVPL